MSFSRTDARHSSGHPPREKLPNVLCSGMEASWGKKSPSVRQAYAKQGIPLCFVWEMGKAAPLVLGSRAGAIEGTAGKARQAPRAPADPFQAPGGQRKVVLLPATPGDRAVEAGQWSPLLQSGGCHTAMASCRTGQEAANMIPLVCGAFKGQGQNKPGEEKSSTGAGPELGVEPGELDTGPAGSQVGRTPTG